MKLKWTAMALDAYKKTGEQMKGMGLRALREVKDPECQTVLTFWSGIDGTVIQQTWTDTGDVVLYRTVSETELEGMLSQEPPAPALREDGTFAHLPSDADQVSPTAVIA